MGRIVLSIAFIALLLKVVSCQCPTGFSIGGTRSCYRYFPQAVTWEDAESTCNSISGATLASIDSLDENTHVVAQINNQGPAWIGLNDRTTEQETSQNGWVWSDGTVFSYRNWATSEPSGTTAAVGTTPAVQMDCVAISTAGTWSDEDCDGTMAGFVCRVDNVCFHGDGVVLTRSSEKLVKELVPGDQVLSLSPEGIPMWDEVYMIVHKDALARARFTQINLDDGSYLRLTGKHHVVTARGDISADEVRAQDWMYVVNASSVSLQQVSSTSTVSLPGIYNPVTKAGHLVVNSVLASSYAPRHLPEAVASAPVAHSLLWPVRQVYQVVPAVSLFKLGPQGIPTWWPALTKICKFVA